MYTKMNNFQGYRHRKAPLLLLTITNVAPPSSSGLAILDASERNNKA